MPRSRVVATDVARANGWRRWIAGASGGSSLLLAGCLVTDHPQYGQPNVPAHLVRGAPNDFVRAKPDDQCEGASLMRPRVSFRLGVSDANVDDRLIAHVFVNGNPISLSNKRIDPTGDALRRPLVLCVDLAELNESPCNLIEVLVSREFDEAFPDRPELLGDLSSERWWLFAASDTIPDATPEDCASQEGVVGEEQ